jgi:mannose-6-phosphate isomerase-like protein (cupin superfamily)
MQYSKESQVEGFEAIPPYERTLKVLLSPQANRTKNMSLGMTILDPGSSSSPHSHETEEEIWFVVSGTGLATVAEETIHIEEGTAIYIPPKQTHQLVNEGSEKMRVLWAFSPPGPEAAYFGRKGGEA